MFGMGFTEIMIIVVIAILFLGPDKLPSAMVDIAKLFRSAKKTINSVKDSIEQEMSVSEIKQEALAYKKELLETSNEIKEATDITDVQTTLASLGDNILDDIDDDDDDNIEDDEPKIKKAPKTSKKNKEITFEKTKKEDVDA